MTTKGTCFYCLQKDVLIYGQLLGHDTCMSCFTTEPSEMHWEIYRTHRKVERRKWELDAPNRKRRREQEEKERFERGERKMPIEMTSEELIEHEGEMGKVLVALRKELESLPELA